MWTRTILGHAPDSSSRARDLVTGPRVGLSRAADRALRALHPEVTAAAPTAPRRRRRTRRRRALRPAAAADVAAGLGCAALVGGVVYRTAVAAPHRVGRRRRRHCGGSLSGEERHGRVPLHARRRAARESRRSPAPPPLPAASPGCLGGRQARDDSLVLVTDGVTASLSDADMVAKLRDTVRRGRAAVGALCRRGPVPVLSSTCGLVSRRPHARRTCARRTCVEALAARAARWRTSALKSPRVGAHDLSGSAECRVPSERGAGTAARRPPQRRRPSPRHYPARRCGIPSTVRGGCAATPGRQAAATTWRRCAATCAGPPSARLPGRQAECTRRGATRAASASAACRRGGPWRALGLRGCVAAAGRGPRTL